MLGSSTAAFRTASQMTSSIRSLPLAVLQFGPPAMSP